MMAKSHRVAIIVTACLLGGPAQAQSVYDIRLYSYKLSFSSGSLSFPVYELGFHAAELLAPVETSAKEQRFRLSGDVLFDFDKDSIRREADALLAGLAERIRAEFAGAAIRVEGHTDAKGSDAYNQDLSVRRADSVKAWFEANGFSVPIQTTGFGESQPVEANQLPDGSDNPAGRQQNRRVEIVVEKRS